MPKHYDITSPYQRSTRQNITREKLQSAKINRTTYSFAAAAPFPDPDAEADFDDSSPALLKNQIQRISIRQKKILTPRKKEW
jgi:hypothetical protein